MPLPDPTEPDERVLPPAPAPRVLFSTTNRWASDCGLLRAFRRAGASVALLAPADHPARSARVDRLFTQDRFRPRTGLARAIDAFAPDLLVPGDERARRAMHALHARGSAADRALVERSLGRPDGYGTMLSRAGTMGAARAAGIPVPADAADPTPAGLEEFLRSSPTGAIVLKMDGTWAGDGVRVIRSSAELAAALDTFCRRRLLRGVKRFLRHRDPHALLDRLHGLRPAISAQQFLPGHVGDVALFCRDGTVLGATVAEREAGLGGLGPSTIIRVVDRPALVASAARLVRTLGLSGFIGLDFIVDPITDEARVIEINPRATGLAAVRPLAGSSPATAAARALGAEPVAEDPPRPLVAYFPKAWQHDPSDTRLARCVDDIPADEPNLVESLLAPRPPARPIQPRGRGVGAALHGLPAMPMSGH